MEDRYNHEAQGYPLAPPSMPRSHQTIYTNSSTNYTNYHTKRRKTIKRLTLVAIFVSTLAATLLVLGRATTPRVRLVDVTLTNNNNNDNFLLTGRVLVRNRNFWRYEFDGAMGTVRAANGTSLGRFAIHDGRASARSTRRIYVFADLRGPLGSGEARLRVEARLRGEVRVLRVVSRDRSAVLNCTISVGLPIRGVQNLRCQ
ncbi:late embryogenesis abundant protein [Striga asiatica]|uniref:Late embryogenesis abundant protein n=1 Tax=Striga asiatica TaxID=4170 RepID=A0A5A7PCI0_STRAF|nr:late embryogenesis abundant protein [Striga asiatica]